MDNSNHRSMKSGMNPKPKTAQGRVGSIWGQRKMKRGRQPDNRSNHTNRIKDGAASETANGKRNRTPAPGHKRDTENTGSTSKTGKVSSNVKAGGER
jgi:hypothetical protein